MISLRKILGLCEHEWKFHKFDFEYLDFPGFTVYFRGWIGYEIHKCLICLKEKRRVLITEPYKLRRPNNDGLDQYEFVDAGKVKLKITRNIGKKP